MIILSGTQPLWFLKAFIYFFCSQNVYLQIVDHEFHPANIYLFKVNNKNNRKRCEICSKLTVKTPEICQ